MSAGLKEVLEKYVAAAGAYGRTVPLSSLGYSKQQVEETLGAFDEDYHISRFFHFTCDPGTDHFIRYNINGFPQTHLSIDSEVQSIL